MRLLMRSHLRETIPKKHPREAIKTNEKATTRAAHQAGELSKLGDLIDGNLDSLHLLDVRDSFRGII